MFENFKLPLLSEAIFYVLWNLVRAGSQFRQIFGTIKLKLVNIKILNIGLKPTYFLPL